MRKVRASPMVPWFVSSCRPLFDTVAISRRNGHTKETFSASMSTWRFFSFMDRIWAPWRVDYLTQAPEPGCIFCVKPRQDLDSQNYILARGRECFVIMNLYPYTNGHLMVVPYRHTSDIDDLTPECCAEIFALLKTCRHALRDTMNPHGFNIGANLGRVAGAGIHDHVHFHIVPRWNGDTNFMPVLAEARVISEHIEETYFKLLPHFSKPAG